MLHTTLGLAAQGMSVAQKQGSHPNQRHFGHLRLSGSCFKRWLAYGGSGSLVAKHLKLGTLRHRQLTPSPLHESAHATFALSLVLDLPGCGGDHGSARRIPRTQPRCSHVYHLPSETERQRFERASSLGGTTSSRCWIPNGRATDLLGAFYLCTEYDQQIGRPWLLYICMYELTQP